MRIRDTNAPAAALTYPQDDVGPPTGTRGALQELLEQLLIQLRVVVRLRVPVFRLCITAICGSKWVRLRRRVRIMVRLRVEVRVRVGISVAIGKVRVEVRVWARSRARTRCRVNGRKRKAAPSKSDLYCAAMSNSYATQRYTLKRATSDGFKLKARCNAIAVRPSLTEQVQHSTHGSQEDCRAKRRLTLMRSVGGQSRRENGRKSARLLRHQFARLPPCELKARATSQVGTEPLQL